MSNHHLIIYNIIYCYSLSLLATDLLLFLKIGVVYYSVNLKKICEGKKYSQMILLILNIMARHFFRSLYACLLLI